MTKNEITALCAALNPEGYSFAQSEMRIRCLLDELNINDTSLLLAIQKEMLSAGALSDDIASIFRHSVRSPKFIASESVRSVRMWLRVRISSDLLIQRLRNANVEGSFLGISSVSGKQFLKIGLTEPTSTQVDALMLIASIVDTDDLDTQEPDINYVAGRLSDIEPLVPELKRRGVFDRGTIEMLLTSQTLALREGEL